MSECRRHTSNPDQLRQETVQVVENVPVARDTCRIRFECPAIARRIVPGQFVMVRLPGTNDPLLGRPLALYDVVVDASGEPRALDLVYQAIGRMTRRLTAWKPGDRLEVWGPLGNGFPPTPAEHLILVAGGIGQTPFLSLAQEYLGLRSYGDPPRQVPRAGRVSLCYGCRTAEYVACVEDFRRSGVTVHLSTDDGSAGRRGLVTELVPPLVAGSGSCRLVACGPEKMLHASVAMAGQLGVPCQVSLESPMACGIGVCFSCVAKIRDTSGQWDYRRICVEGPVFDAADVEF